MKEKHLFVNLICIVCWLCPQCMIAQNWSDYDDVKNKMSQLIGEWAISGSSYAKTPFCFKIDRRSFDNEIEIRIPATVDNVTGAVLSWQESVLFPNLNCFNNATYGYEIAGANTRRRSSYGINYKLSNGGYEWGVVQIVFAYDDIQTNRIKAYVRTADGRLEDKKKDMGLVTFIRHQNPLQDITLYSNDEDIKKLANAICVETLLSHGYNQSTAEKVAKAIEGSMLELAHELRANEEDVIDAAREVTMLGMFSKEQLINRNKEVSNRLPEYFKEYVEGLIEKNKNNE